MNNSNQLITCKEREEVIKSLPTKKSPWKDSFRSKFCQNQEVITILLKGFHIIETEVRLPNPFYEATVTLIPNHTKIQTRRIPDPSH